MQLLFFHKASSSSPLVLIIIIFIVRHLPNLRANITPWDWALLPLNTARNFESATTFIKHHLTISRSRGNVSVFQEPGNLSLPIHGRNTRALKHFNPTRPSPQPFTPEYMNYVARLTEYYYTRSLWWIFESVLKRMGIYIKRLTLEDCRFTQTKPKNRRHRV